MPDHEWPCRALFFRQRQELDGKLARHVAVERDKVRDPQAVKDGEQQQRIFRRLSERLRLFNQQASALDRCSRFWRRVAPDMEEGGYKLHLKLDLIATQRGCAWQSRDQVERASELFRGFDQGRALSRPLPGLPPKRRRSFDLTRLGEVTRQQLGLVLGDLVELALEDFGDTSMKVASRLAQQQAISRVLHEGVFEQINCVWRHALPEQQPGSNESVELHFQFRLRPARHCSE